jgi:hypothetical protein
MTLMPLRPDLPFSPLRRGLLLGGGGAAFLSACGGGGAEDDGGSALAIREFSADRSSYFVGERAQIVVRYRGASARIEPGIGEVASGVVITTDALVSRQRLQLVVSAPGQPSVSRELWLDVRYRDRWQSADALTSSLHAAVTTAAGQVLVIGGSRGIGILSDGVDRFDPASGRFQRIGALSSGRSNHSAVRLGDGRILVCGGLTASSEGAFAELVDEDSGHTQRAGTMVEPRVRHAATLLADGRVLVSGGGARDSAELWDPATRRWRRVAARMAHDRQFHTATALADGRVLIAGGLRQTGGDYVFAELFDPRTETFTPLATGITQQRQLHAAHLCSDHGVLVFGGEAAQATVEPLASVLRFDPATNRFTNQAPLLTPRTLVASVRLPGDEVLLIGGEVPGDLASSSGVHWRGGDQRVLAPLPGGRVWHTVNALPDGRVVVIGGQNADGNYVAQTVVYE